MMDRRREPDERDLEPVAAALDDPATPRFIVCSTCHERRVLERVVEIPLPGAPPKPIYGPCRCDREREQAEKKVIAIRPARNAALEIAEHVNPVGSTFARYRDASLDVVLPDGKNAAAYGRACVLRDALFASPTGRDVVGFGMVGGNGTGKTHLGVALVRDLRGAGIPALIYTVSDLLRAITQTWGDEVRAAEFFEYLASAPLLVLDDLGKEHVRPNSWSASTFFDVVNARWNRALPIVASTNADVTKLPERYGEASGEMEAILDRLHGIFALEWIALEGGSRRWG